MRRALPWMGLLRAVVAAQIFLLALAAFALSDVEAVGFTVLSVALVLLTYWRRGVVATVLLGVMFIDVLGWMAPGWISNLQHHERVAASVGPALLAAVAVSGLAAVISRLVLGFDRASRADARPAAWAMAALVVVALAITAARSGSGRSDRARPGDVGVTMHGVKFSPTTITATSAIGVALTNHDLFWHTFTVKGEGLSVRVPVGGHRRASLARLAPGRYHFYCSIPGHDAAGMHGTLLIIKDKA